MTMIGNIIKYSLFGLMASLLFSCGSADEWGGGDWGNDSVTCPPDSTITLLEGSKTYSVGDATLVTFNDLYTIAVTDTNDLPIRDAKLRISFIWGSPQLFDLTPWGGANPDWVIQFYESGIPVPSGFTALTNDFGIYELNFQWKGGGEDPVGPPPVPAISYTGDFTATCGANIGTETFTVQ